MIDTDLGRFIAIVILMTLVFVCGVWAGISDCYDKWQSEAIKHGAAHYDAKTGAFTWNTEVEP